MNAGRLTRMGVVVAWAVGTGALAAEADPLRELRAYKPGQPQRVLRTVERIVARATGDAARRAEVAGALAAVLTDGKASLVAKRFACWQLGLVAGDEHVGVLAKLLGDAELGDAARRALAGIPAEAAGAALRRSLNGLKGPARVGVIHSLGERRDAAAVDVLGKLLGAPDRAVANAAAKALGKIGTPEAGRALGAANAAASRNVLVDARLRCGEGLLADGKAADAETLYRGLYATQRDGVWCVAALTGLARAAGDKALPEVMKAAGSDDAQLRSAALRAARSMRGGRATKALAAALDDLPPEPEALLIGVLAERGDAQAAAAVTKRLEDKDEAVRVAALAAMATLGDSGVVGKLLAAAAGKYGAAQQAARASLGRMTAAGVDEALLAASRRGSTAVRVEAIGALKSRRPDGAEATLTALSADAEEAVAVVSLDALAATGTAACYPKVIDRIRADSLAVARAAEKAALAVGGRLATPADRSGPVLAALKGAPVKAKPALFALLAAGGGREALAAVRAGVEEADATVASGAVRALANWPDASAAADLLRIARADGSRVHRTLALRGYLRLVRTVGDAAARLRMLDAVRRIATTAADKRLLLSALGGVADAGALDVAVGMAADKAVHKEAVLAAVSVGKTLLGSDRAAVRSGMETLRPQVADPALRKQVEALHAQSLKPPRRRGGGGSNVGLAPDKARSDAARKEIARRGPKGDRLVCYLDCGPDDADGAKGGPSLRSLDGAKYSWAGADRVNVRHGTIRFDSRAVRFEIAGLRPNKAYRLGFTWWDYDHNDRVESVWATAGRPARRVRLLAPTKLPSYAVGEKKAAEVTVPIPRAVSAFGTVQVTFALEGGTNAVVSEVWLWESEAEHVPVAPMPAQADPPKGPAGRRAPRKAGKSKADAPRVTEPRAVRPGKKGVRRVLIVTGNDYPGHKWRQTTPVLAAGLDKDPRLAVEFVEKGDFLASGKLGDYDAIVLHWMNWETPDPGPKAREGLAGYVRAGGGLVLVHFACGAFQGWEEFAKLAGRAWNPKLRGHDPRGTFRVDIDDGDHPITRGMKPFETHDELYTCLEGKADIHVLVSSVSKVDKKKYPMAFVLTYGKGRVFHCPLGHDVKAFEAPPVLELFRRGTAWAAGLAPVGDKAAASSK